jgi:membrane protein implicated in regulation of membrane protease activity
MEFYARNRRLEEWMIYRFVACFLLGSFGLLLLLATALTNLMAQLGSRRAEAARFWPSLVSDVLTRPLAIALLIVALLGAGGFVLWPGIAQFITTGTVDLHWSRLLVGAFALFGVGHLVVFGVLFKVVSIWRDQRLQRRQAEPVDALDVSTAAESRVTRATRMH